MHIFICLKENHIIDKMSGQNKNGKKANFTKLPPKIRKRLQKHDKRLFPLHISSKAMREMKSDPKKLTIEIKCYRCKRNNYAKFCKECMKPICNNCETHKPEGYCKPCRDKLLKAYLSKKTEEVFETFLHYLSKLQSKH